MDEHLPRLHAALANRYTIERELGRGGIASGSERSALDVAALVDRYGGEIDWGELAVRAAIVRLMARDAGRLALVMLGVDVQVA